MSRAIVLLSSGLDSTVNLFCARRELDVVAVLTFNYGQRAAEREAVQARKITSLLGLRHEIIDLPWLKNITKTSLVNAQVSVPKGADVKIDDLTTSQETAKAVWVPNRNGVFLNIAASFAESLDAQWVIPGFNKEEATTFPDNSGDFLRALDQSFSFSTAKQVKTKCFTTDKNKIEIVQLGRELNVPFDLMWPCYFGGEEICGKCESCQRFLRAVEA